MHPNYFIGDNICMLCTETLQEDQGFLDDLLNLPLKSSMEHANWKSSNMQHEKKTKKFATSYSYLR